MGATTTHKGVLLTINSDEPTWTTLARIADWIEQFSSSDTPKLEVSDIHSMLRTEQKRLSSEVGTESVGEGEIEVAEVFDVDLNETGTNPYSVKNIYADKYVVNNYYGSDKSED